MRSGPREHQDRPLTINGEVFEETVPIRMLLTDFIRDRAGLTGTHVGCTYEGVCGACTVCSSTAKR